MSKSSLRQKLEAGTFVLTAEITPPLSANPSDLLERGMPLKGLADAVNVTDGASARAHLESTVAAYLLLVNGIEPVLQLTCRDRNRIALQSQLVGAAALGIVNVLALTGDNPKAGDQPDAKPVFDLDSSGLIATAASIRDKHQLPHGRAVDGSPDYFIGAADSPLDPPEGWVPASLQKKLKAGAQFTQNSILHGYGDPATLSCVPRGARRAGTPFCPGWRGAARVREVGALDPGQPAGVDHSGLDRRTPGKCRRSKIRRRSDLRGTASGDEGDTGRFGRTYHGAAQ